MSISLEPIFELFVALENTPDDARDGNYCALQACYFYAMCANNDLHFLTLCLSKPTFRQVMRVGIDAQHNCGSRGGSESDFREIVLRLNWSFLPPCE